MVRTRDTAGVKVSGAKASRKVSSSVPSPRGLGVGIKKISSSSGPSNRVCKREVPDWQKPITQFIKLSDTNGSEDENSKASTSKDLKTEADADSTTDMEQGSNIEEVEPEDEEMLEESDESCDAAEDEAGTESCDAAEDEAGTESCDAAEDEAGTEGPPRVNGCDTVDKEVYNDAISSSNNNQNKDGAEVNGCEVVTNSETEINSCEAEKADESNCISSGKEENEANLAKENVINETMKDKINNEPILSDKNEDKAEK